MNPVGDTSQASGNLHQEKAQEKSTEGKDEVAVKDEPEESVRWGAAAEGDAVAVETGHHPESVCIYIYIYNT